ncbi:C-repeat binding factor [Thalictrum thalictroides]|uniref:C-repeat binding factor n=1 Tax=Thalictrum thalictroides TaxID=46969 RepID=A0A7J6UQJ5_THATH|nr:C-repeat binding factor [Thalictrum thalictroides]
MAARAHDVAALALRGRSACLNFADSIWRLPIPVSADAKDIRKAACEAAEMFRQSMSMSMSPERITKDVAKVDNNNMFYWDEEAGLLASMAEGLLLSPPPTDDHHFNWENENDCEEISLWSF